MKRNAFTLIELLAVIVILAIIALIAVPIVINIINDAKEESLKRSAQNYLDVVTSTITKENLKVKYNPDECIIQEDGNLICSENGSELTTSDGTKILKIDIKGKKPSSGTILLKDGKVLDLDSFILEGKTFIIDSNNNLVLFKYKRTNLSPGIYDSNKNLLATFDTLVNDYGLQISNDYDFDTATNEGSGSLYSVVNYNDELKNTSILIIPKTVNQIGLGALNGISNLEVIEVEKGNTVYEDRNSNAIIEKETNKLILGCNSTIIPNGVTSIEMGAFAFSNIKNITIPESVTTFFATSFYNCNNLISLKFNKTNGWYVRGFSVDPRNDKYNALFLKENMFDLGNYPIVNKDLDPGLYDQNYNLIATYDELVNDYGLDIERDYSDFSEELGESIENLGSGSMYKVLINNEELYNGRIIVLPESITKIGSCAFYGCTSLTSITIPDSVTSIGESAFVYCTGLLDIIIPSSVTNIEVATFIKCTRLLSIIIPSSVTSIGDGAFYDCTSLTSIEIPSSVTSIGRRAFESCKGLTSIEIPSSVTSIGDGAFYDCTSLTSITISNSVTTIGDGAFHGCTSLTSITIPSSVTSIGNYAFEDCTGLTSVTFENTQGWFTASSSSETTGDNIDVTNPNTNATNLKDTYYNKYWKRN